MEVVDRVEDVDRAKDVDRVDVVRLVVWIRLHFHAVSRSTNNIRLPCVASVSDPPGL